MTYSSIYKKVCDALDWDPLDYEGMKMGLEDYEVLGILIKKGISQKEIEDAWAYACFEITLLNHLKKNLKKVLQKKKDCNIM